MADWRNAIGMGSSSTNFGEPVSVNPTTPTSTPTDNTPTGTPTVETPYSGMAYDTFLQYAQLAGFQDGQMIKDVYEAAKPYISDQVPPSDLLDLVASSGKVDSFNQYLKDYNDIRKVAPEITTIADWNRSKQSYKTLMGQYGLSQYATDENVNQFLKNGVSAAEAADRMSAAYNAVNNADEALKKELQTYFPSLKTPDLVATILGVGKTKDELQKQISTAGISAEMTTAGLGNVLNASDLAAQGISRGQARQGFQQTALEAGAFNAAAARAGISNTGLTQELAQENVTGLASQRRKQIAQAEQNLFEGQSGTATGISLGSVRAGKF